MKTTAATNWMETRINGGFHVHINMAFQSIMQNALDNGAVARHMNRYGNPDVPIRDMLAFIDALKGRCIYSNGEGTQKFFAWTDSILSVTIGEYSQWEMFSVNEELFEKVQKWTGQHLKMKKVRGEVFAVSKVGVDELDLVRIGVAGAPLERGNYSPKVLEDFDYIVSQFNSDTPLGRIVVLEGEPGTGKTYFVRGLLSELEKALCVTIPPGGIEALSSPDFLPLLLRNKKPDQPIVLIVEDADQCLVKRDRDNMPTISSLLNLGDGIFGSTFDIRIICTTNAKVKEMDPAVTREGRLCRRASIGTVSATQANKISKRLLEKSRKTPPKFSKPTTLAHIYAMVAKVGLKASAPEPKKKTKQENPHLGSYLDLEHPEFG